MNEGRNFFLLFGIAKNNCEQFILSIEQNRKWIDSIKGNPHTTVPRSPFRDF